MYANIKGKNLYYQSVGQGKNLIIIHGWMQDSSSFWNIVPLLKNDFQIYMIDLPGFGRSDMHDEDLTVYDYSEIVADFIKTQKIKSPVILGHSLGGRVAIKLASNYPDLIDKLILEDAAGIKPKRDFLKTLIYPWAKVFHYLMPNTFGFKTKIQYKFYKNIEADYISAGKLKSTLANILAEDLTSDIKKIKNETFLIWGENDPTKEASLKNGKKIYRMIENSRIEVFDGVGHFPHLENPELFSYYVKDFS